MKITKRQFRRIIKEERSKLVREMNPDGSISADEDAGREALLREVENTIYDLIQTVQMRADEIGGSFRSPGIRAQAFKLIADAIHEAR